MPKRTRDDTSWDDFVTKVRTTIDKNYEQVNTLQSSPLSISIYMPTGSRIPVDILSVLKYENYGSTYVISVQQLEEKNNICVQVSYSTKHGRIEDQVQSAELMLQSPRVFLEKNLQLKDKKTIDTVERLVKEVHKKFPRQMNWTGVPYQMIYFKKHNQIILRFKFTGDFVPFSNDLKDETLKKGWIEYATKTKQFYFVSVVENCC